MGQLRLSLLERDLIGPRVDLREKIALVHPLALLETHLHQQPVDLGVDGDGGQRRDRPQGAQGQSDVAAADARRPDGLIAAVEKSPAPLRRLGQEGDRLVDDEAEDEQCDEPPEYPAQDWAARIQGYGARPHGIGFHRLHHSTRPPVRNSPRPAFLVKNRQECPRILVAKPERGC